MVTSIFLKFFMLQNYKPTLPRAKKAVNPFQDLLLHMPI